MSLEKTVTVSLDGGAMIVNQRFLELLQLNGLDNSQALWNYQGEDVKKQIAERSTQRVFLHDENGEQIECYIKRYSKIPLREKLKNILCFKPFAFDAFHEFKAISTFLEHGIDTMQPIAAASGPDGSSINLTLGIQNCTRASDLFAALEDRKRRHHLTEAIGSLAGKMHRNGLAHQDFYLVHLFVRESKNDRLFVIDLQRVLMRRRLALRWRVKDLAQILFAGHKFISFGDKGRFWRAYCAEAGENFYRNRKLIRKIIAKASRIIRRDNAKACR